MSEGTRVVMADDDALIRLLLRRAIQSRPELTLVGEASDGAGALALIAEHAPDVAVLDISMPDPDGLEVTRRVRAAEHDCAIVIFSSSTGHEAAALEAGADRFVDKAGGVDGAVAAALAVTAGPARGG